ncbi:MAG: hypothetical protein KAR32_04125, partial [Candidatus Omnitrophica bacterium]|nr:hypothetical protein [Candidatus Omnitrophota bacterium]
MVISGKVRFVRFIKDRKGRLIEDMLGNHPVIDIRQGFISNQIKIKLKLFQEEKAFEVKKKYESTASLFIDGKCAEASDIFSAIIFMKKSRVIPVFEEVLIAEKAKYHISFYRMHRKAISTIRSKRQIARKGGEHLLRLFKDAVYVFGFGDYAAADKGARDIIKQLEGNRILPTHFKQVVLNGLGRFRKVIGSVRNSGDSKDVFFNAKNLLFQQGALSGDTAKSIQSIMDIDSFNRKNSPELVPELPLKEEFERSLVSQAQHSSEIPCTLDAGRFIKNAPKSEGSGFSKSPKSGLPSAHERPLPENEKIQPEWKRFEDIKETLGLLPAGEAYPQRTMLLLSELLGSKPESLREEIKRSDKAERKLNLRELLRTLSAEGLLTRRFYAVNRRVKLYDEEIKVLSLIIEAAAMEKDFVSMVVAEGMVQQQLLSQIRSLSMKLKTDLLEKIFITIETRKVPLEQRKAQKKVIEDEIAEVSRDKIRTNFVKFFEDMDFVAQKTELPATDSQNTENN